MHQLIIDVLCLIIGIISGFIGGIASGGGLIAIPCLMMVGLPPTTAIATNNLAAASSVSSAFRYHKSKLIQRDRLSTFLLISLLGGILGSQLLLHISGEVMYRIFGLVSIGLAILFAFTKIKPTTKSSHSVRGLLALLFASVFAGLFGTGGGFFTIYALCYFYGLTIMEANANSKMINLGGLPIILIFANAGVINFTAGIPLMIGAFIGGYMGAHTAIKKGDKTVKNIILVAVLISGLKLLMT